jgi:uncharacterized protein HemY
MSIFSLVLIIALALAVIAWLTGYRLPVYRRPSMGHKPQRSVTGQVTRATRQQMMRLVNGNRGVAERLVGRVRSQNPDRSEQWCWEKAIYDIQRDRRS